METPLSPAVVEALSALTEEQQLEVIALASEFNAPQTREERIEGWKQLGDKLSDEEAAKMLADIEEGCGQINHDAW